ncbi:hypothetical protein WJX74_002534 [Apatococcus lobatus]|uniref:Uncharacterized protein n=1 Tax=Apatococcus lobatus TaxID=904363 RepID=A0AAW1SEL7_9CHLO
MWGHLSMCALLALTATFSGFSEGVELPGVHEVALSKALQKASAPQKTVIFTIFDGNMGSMMFPVFIRSLKHTAEAKHLLVICQDDSAFALCTSMHQVSYGTANQSDP